LGECCTADAWGDASNHQRASQRKEKDKRCQYCAQASRLYSKFSSGCRFLAWNITRKYKKVFMVRDRSPVTSVRKMSIESVIYASYSNFLRSFRIIFDQKTISLISEWIEPHDAIVQQGSGVTTLTLLPAGLLHRFLKTASECCDQPFVFKAMNLFAYAKDAD
jgi:hypothetical protein